MSKDYAAICEIQIEDFRCIENLRLSFLNPQGDPTRIAVIGGPNGCGKTAVLEAIVLAGGGFGMASASIAFRSIPIGGHRIEIRGKAAIGQREIPIKALFNLNPDIPTSDLRLTPWEELPILYIPSNRSSGLLQEIHISNPTQPGSGSGLGPQGGFGPQGVSAEAHISSPPQPQEKMSWLIDVQKRLLNSRLHELLSSQRNGTGSLSFSQAILKINEAWQRFYPGQSFTVEPIGPTPDLGFNVFLNRTDGNRIEVNYLSSGQLELFGFISDLATRDSKPGIIVIDEPELHLDPQWHRFVLQILLDLRPRSQIVVATHSPEIFGSVASYERHFLVSNDDPRAALWQRELADAGVAK